MDVIIKIFCFCKNRKTKIFSVITPPAPPQQDIACEPNDITYTDTQQFILPITSGCGCESL